MYDSTNCKIKFTHTECGVPQIEEYFDAFGGVLVSEKNAFFCAKEIGR
jgi:hypothetical protein